MHYPSSIQKLIDKFSKLPTVGPKTAERYVFYLLQQNKAELDDFSQAVADLKKSIKICKNCMAVSEANPCPVCTSNDRDQKTICIVANTRDMIAIESTKQHNGLYHVLGGVINTVRDSRPDKVSIEKLLIRIQQENIEEIILALDANIEGETTAIYIAKILKEKNQNLKITKLARGLPSGSGLEYADEMTLANAFKNRTLQ